MKTNNEIDHIMVVKLFNAYKKTVWFLTGCIGIILIIMVGLTVKEMLARNLGFASAWTSEATEIMILWVFLVPMAFSQMDGGMVRVTFIVDKFPEQVKAIFKILASIMAVLFAFSLCYANYSFFVQTVAGGYYPETGWPVIIQRALPPTAAFLLIIASFLCILRELTALKLKRYEVFNEGVDH